MLIPLHLLPRNSGTPSFGGELIRNSSLDLKETRLSLQRCFLAHLKIQITQEFRHNKKLLLSVYMWCVCIKPFCSVQKQMTHTFSILDTSKSKWSNNKRHWLHVAHEPLKTLILDNITRGKFMGYVPPLSQPGLYLGSVFKHFQNRLPFVYR